MSEPEKTPRRPRPFLKYRGDVVSCGESFLVHGTVVPGVAELWGAHNRAIGLLGGCPTKEGVIAWALRELALAVDAPLEEHGRWRTVGEPVWSTNQPALFDLNGRECHVVDRGEP